MIDAVYDASVLFSASLRDLLINLAFEGVVRAHWSDEIPEEWIRSLLRKRPDLKRENLERTRRCMDRQVVGGLVTGYQNIVPTLLLPDPNDRHVLAVAIYTNSQYIVTNNLNNFPSQTLAPYKIEAVSPDNFVVRLIDSDAEGVLAAAEQHRSDLQRPPKTVDEYLATLKNQQLSKTVAFLRRHWNEI